MKHLWLLRSLVPLLLVVSITTSCSGSKNQDQDTTTTVFLGQATASRVLLAAVILASGDIEKAISEGLVTSVDVDAASAAIKDGTLDVWRERAEAELSE